MGELTGGRLASVVFGALDSHSTPCSCSFCYVVLAYGDYAREGSITTSEMSYVAMPGMRTQLQPSSERPPHLPSSWISILASSKFIQQHALGCPTLALSSPRWWVGAQPQRGVSRLHRLSHYPNELAAQGLQVRLVPEPGREGHSTALPSLNVTKNSFVGHGANIGEHPFYALG